jgi:hypothetical protein
MRTLSLLFLITFSNLTFSQQSFTGIVSDNVVSSSLISYNPSSIVDSKSKFAISSNANLSKISNFCATDYLPYGSKSKYVESKNPGFKNKYASLDLLNVKYEFTHENAVAYSLKFRSFDNLGGLPTIWSKNTTLDYGKNTIKHLKVLQVYRLHE